MAPMLADLDYLVKTKGFRVERWLMRVVSVGSTRQRRIASAPRKSLASSPSMPPAVNQTAFPAGTTRDREPLFHVRSLAGVYGEGGAAVTALRGVDFDLFAGELIVLLGASGSGKSTLLNQLGGLDSPTSGTLLYRGANLAEFDEPQ